MYLSTAIFICGSILLSYINFSASIMTKASFCNYKPFRIYLFSIKLSVKLGCMWEITFNCITDFVWAKFAWTLTMLTKLHSVTMIISILSLIDFQYRKSYQSECTFSAITANHANINCRSNNVHHLNDCSVCYMLFALELFYSSTSCKPNLRHLSYRVKQLYIYY